MLIEGMEDKVQDMCPSVEQKEKRKDQKVRSSRRVPSPQLKEGQREKARGHGERRYQGQVLECLPELKGLSFQLEKGLPDNGTVTSKKSQTKVYYFEIIENQRKKNNDSEEKDSSHI